MKDVGTGLISIHAPSRERLIAVLLMVHLSCISIHAPLRERLCRHSDAIHQRQHFNPRSLAGANYKVATALATLMEFQSTLPRESD